LVRSETSEDLVVVTERRVAEHHLTESWDLDLERQRPAGERRQVLGRELLGHPPNSLVELLRDPRQLFAPALREDRAFTVPADEPNRNRAVE
jgi:hypothetical protein